MGKEIERKFLVTDDSWREAEGRDYSQGYLSIDKERTVRVRIEENRAHLTIKGITEGATRAEYEYSIPVADARTLLDDLCLQPLIKKRRYKVNYRGMVWEIDEFSADNAGLVVAEIELQHPEQTFDLPPWIGEEVTDDPRFYNANLVTHPYSRWKK